MIRLLESHHAIDRLITQPDVEPDTVTVALPALLPTVANTVCEESAKFKERFQKLCPADGPSAIDLLVGVN